MNSLVNITQGPRGLNMKGGGTFFVDPGKEIPTDLDIADGELEAAKKAGYFGSPSQIAEVPQPGVVADPAGQKAVSDLAAIAAMFDDPEVNPGNVRERVEALIAEVAAFDGDGDGAAGGSKAKLTLVQAVASLDNKNDAHWIASGKPNIDVLKELTGKDVTRAEVDAITPPRVRQTT